VPSRRAFITAGGLALAGLAVPRARAAAPVEIGMMSDTLGTAVWFDPIGVHVQPGQTVRFTVHANVHTTTAYHPKNDHHSLRIPERAVPWDSRFLVNPGSHFEVTLTVPGVYDYFCAPPRSRGWWAASWWGSRRGRARSPSTTSAGVPGPRRGYPCRPPRRRRFRA